MSVDQTLSFGVWIKRLRTRLDLTQERLAEQVGCAVQTIRAFERETRRPSQAMAQRLADILEVPASERKLFLRLARARATFETDTAAAAPADVAVAAPRERLAPLKPTVDLVGRKSERAELLRRLRTPGRRLITLIGPGGMGKTSLALHVAAELSAGDAPAFADGVAVAYLAAAASVGEMYLAIADAIGYSIQGARAIADQLIEALAERSFLVMLDNLEHLLGPDNGDAVAALIGRILAAAPGIRLLITSRERLRLRDEWVLELGGLELPATDRWSHVERSEAVRLFAERAGRVDRAFTLDAERSVDVARICRRLEGMPLAIELAAAWSHTLMPREIAAEIVRSLDFLTRTDRDAPARHRSMRAALDHSWILLDDDERRTLACLSVFRGGCDRAAAAAVVSSEFRVLSSDQDKTQLKTHNSKLITLLGALIDKSLLRREEIGGATRYSMHELVRQYAAERLGDDPDDQAATEARHTAYYAGLLQRAIDVRTGLSTPEAQTALDHNIDNLRAAWARSAAALDTAVLAAMARGMRILYDSRGWLADGAALFGHAAEALRNGADENTAAVRGLMLGLQGFFLGRTGHPTAARPLLDEGLALVHASGSAEWLGELLYASGIIELRLGRYAEAQTSFSQAAALTQTYGDLFRHRWAEFYLGMIAQFHGDYQTATARYQAYLDGWRGQGYARGQAIGLASLGDIARLTGRYDSAAALLGESMRVAGGARDQLAIGIILRFLGALAHDRGELDESRYLLVESAEIMRQLGDTWLLGLALCDLGYTTLAQGQPQAALRAYTDVLQLVHLGETGLTVELACGLAALLARQGRDDETLALLIAVEGASGEHATMQRAALLRTDIARRLGMARHAAAAKRARDRQLLPWLEELCAS